MIQQDNSAPNQPERPAYVTMPGLNCASLIANLPYIRAESEGSAPVIIMDTHDFNWIQALAVKKSNPVIRNTAMGYVHLLMRGVIRLIDYSSFYPQSLQRDVIQRNEELIESVSDSMQRNAAINAAKGWREQIRGSYLDSHRAKLGQKEKKSKKIRREERTRQRKLERGTGGQSRWNQQVLDKHIAALYIARRANRAFDHLDVQKVLGERETEAMKDIFNRAKIGNETTYINRLAPSENVKELDPEGLASTRNIFETISTTAVEANGVQHDDWVLLGPDLTFPQYDSLFNISAIEEELEDNGEGPPLGEVEYVRSTLKRRAETGQDPTSGIEWVMEDANPYVSNPPKQDIIEVRKQADMLTGLSREIRSLEDKVSESALLVGASIVTDPSPHNDIYNMYRYGDSSIAQFTSQAISDNRLNPTFRRTDDWGSELAWHETDGERKRIVW
jgi:hypothetical protein